MASSFLRSPPHRHLSAVRTCTATSSTLSHDDTCILSPLGHGGAVCAPECWCPAHSGGDSRSGSCWVAVRDCAGLADLLPTDNEGFVCKDLKDEGFFCKDLKDEESLGVLSAGASNWGRKCAGRIMRWSRGDDSRMSYSSSPGSIPGHFLHRHSRDRGLHFPLSLQQAHRCFSSSSGGGGRIPPLCWKHAGPAHTPLNLPEFAQTHHVPNHLASLYAKTIPGIVIDPCIDVTSLFLRYKPVDYLRGHMILEKVSSILGLHNSEEIWKLTEEGMFLIKSLIDLLASFHDLRYCIPSLSVETLVINSAGKFELLRDKTKFRKRTCSGVDMDYKNAAAIIKKLISDTMGEDMIQNIPPDAQLLLNKMETDGYKYRYWIGTNMSLMPMNNRSYAYLSFFEYISLYIPNLDTELKGRFLKHIPYQKIWIIMAANNEYVVEWLKYHDKKVTKDQFFKGSNPYGLLLLVRNIIAHRLVLLLKGRVYEAEEIDLMLYAVFPELMPTIQLILFDLDRLRRFKLETYFMDRKITERW